jgi:hypothetical protein
MDDFPCGCFWLTGDAVRPSHLGDRAPVTGYAEVIPNKPDRTITSGLPTNQPFGL